MLRNKIYNLLLVGLILWLGSSCLKSKAPGIPKPVRKIIDLSGINRTQFLEALVKYENKDDSAKRKALFYLIANMGSHYEISYRLTDSNGKVYTFPLKDYPDYHTLIKHFRLTEEKHGKLILQPDTIILDIHSVTAPLLTTTIDSAFYCREHPFFNDYAYSYNDFYEYILPYRVANEKPEPFRHFFREKYCTGLFSILPGNQTDLITLISNIHRMVSNDIKFDKRFEKHFNYPTLSEISETGFGNYRDLAIYEVKAFRSFGIASTMDYSPYFADSAGGLFWPVVKIDDNSFIPVFRSNVPSDRFIAPGRIPKVFRREYKDDSTTLFRIKKISEHTPAFLGQFNYKDVTEEYIPVSDVLIPLTDTSKYTYLAVFNNGAWHPVHWSLTNYNTEANFTKMGLNIVYLPVIIRNKKTIPAGVPFLLQNHNSVRFLSGKSTTSQQQITLTQTAPYRYLKPHRKYNIFIWDNDGWNFYNACLANYRGTIKASVPEKGLYIISEKDFAEHFTDERPFIISNKSLLFY